MLRRLAGVAAASPSSSSPTNSSRILCWGSMSVASPSDTPSAWASNRLISDRNVPKRTGSPPNRSSWESRSHRLAGTSAMASTGCMEAKASALARTAMPLMTTRSVAC
jgi:hypothetical protein